MSQKLFNWDAECLKSNQEFQPWQWKMWGTAATTDVTFFF